MRDIFCFLFILGISVVDLSQDVGGTLKEFQQKLVTQNTEPLEEYDEPVVGGYCFMEYQRCELGFNYVAKPICVYKKKFGLTNFYGWCTISLQNCLIAQQKKLPIGSASLAEEIYHNGKHFDCQYYGEYAKSERQGIIWYFKLGGRNAETEEITQPFENIV